MGLVGCRAVARQMNLDHPSDIFVLITMVQVFSSIAGRVVIAGLQSYYWVSITSILLNIWEVIMRLTLLQVTSISIIHLDLSFHLSILLSFYPDLTFITLFREINWPLASFAGSSTQKATPCRNTCFLLSFFFSFLSPFSFCISSA